MNELAQSIIKNKDHLVIIELIAEITIRNYKTIHHLKNIIQNSIDSLGGTDAWSCDMRNNLDGESEFYLKMAKLIKVEKAYSKETMLQLILESRRHFVSTY